MNNYSETVIIPFFQKKISELQNTVTVLEANILVEQQKSKDLSSELSESSNAKASSDKSAHEQIAVLKAQLAERSAKLDEITSMNALLTKRIEDLKRVIEGQDKNIVEMSSQIKTLTIEASSVKKRKPKEVVLDGSTF